MRVARGAVTSAQRRADQLASQVSEALNQRDRAGEQVQDLDRLRAQVVLDDQRTTRTMLAGTELGAIEFRVCPRCLQTVAEREVEAGACLLCTQPEPAAPTVTLEDEAERLRGQLAETEALLAQARAALEVAAAKVQELQAQLVEARAQADSQARDAVAPFVDRVAVLAEQIGNLRGEAARTGEGLATRRELAKRRTQLAELETRQTRIGDRLDEAKAARQAGRARIDALSDAFDEILRQLEEPWYEPSHIDPDSYLPLVGGRGLEELGSGGMKTLVNDAYFLAGLTYALRAPHKRMCQDS